MANSYTTVDPMTLEEFWAAAEEDGFEVDRQARSLSHDDGRGCHSVIEEEGDDEETYTSSMHDPCISNVEMVQSEEHEACGTEATSDPDEEV